MTDGASDPAELGRLRWRCRLGVRELDELLTRYLDGPYGAATAAERAAFRRLIDSQDGLLHAYCLGTLPPPPEFRELIGQITAQPG